MKNFTINNTEYIENENGYCFKVVDGVKKRVAKAVFDEALKQYEAEQVEVQEEDDMPYEVIDDEPVAEEPVTDEVVTDKVVTEEVKKVYLHSDDIVKEFTNVVNRYLSSGMTFSLGTMSGSQGEVAKVDLTDSKDVYRICLSHDTMFFDDEKGFGGSVDRMILIVEKFVDGYDKREAISKGLGRTLWNGRGDLVETKQWYAPAYHSAVYFDDFEIVKKFSTVRRDRIRGYKAPAPEYELPFPEDKKKNEAMRTKVRDIARKHKGYMRVKRAHLEKLVRVVSNSKKAVYKIYFTEECGKSPLTIEVGSKSV